MRTLSIEESLLRQQHEGLQRQKALETGLLIAQVGDKVDTVLRFVPTPESEDGTQQHEVDRDWVLQHAVQVSRMLPGGIAVIGCYAFAAGAKLTLIETKLQPVLSRIAKNLPSDLMERQAVQLLLPSDSKKPSCRALQAGAPRSQPVELKMQHATPQLVCFCTDWAVDLQLSLRPDEGKSSHVEQLYSQIHSVEEAFARGIATVNGRLLAPAQLASAVGPTTGTLDSPHRVDLFTDSPTAPLADGVAAAATVRIVGTIHGRSFVLPKAEVAAAIEALRRDVVRSLKARVPLLLEQLQEEREDEEEETAADAEESATQFSLRAPACHALPRRAHIDVGDGLSICDYLTSDEDASDCAERLEQLFAFEMVRYRGFVCDSSGNIDDGLGPEDAPCPHPASVGSSTRAMRTDAPRPAASTESSSSKQAGSGKLPLLIALIVVVVAAGAAFVLGSSGGGPIAQEAVQSAALGEAEEPPQPSDATAT